MKLFTLILAIVASGGGALAAPQDLDKQAEREASWTTTTSSLPGVTGTASFAVTETGAMRLVELAPVYAGEVTVKARAGVFKRLSRASQIARACSDLRGTLEYDLADKNKIQLEALVNPLNSRFNSTVETRIQSVRVEPVLSFVNNSTPLTTINRLKTVQDDLGRLFRAQQEDISASGMIKAEMEAIDDVACDLLTGQVKLEVRLVASFDAALLRRQEVMSGRELQTLQESLKAMPAGDGALLSKTLARAANLGVLLHQQLGQNYQSFMQNKFQKLHPAVINVTDASVVNLSFNDAVKAARKLDDLSAALDTNQTVISLKAGWTSY